MKHFGGYLLERWGTSNIFEIDMSDEEFFKLTGWVRAVEDYEMHKQARAIVIAFNGK